MAGAAIEPPEPDGSRLGAATARAAIGRAGAVRADAVRPAAGGAFLSSRFTCAGTGFGACSACTRAGFARRAAGRSGSAFRRTATIASAVTQTGVWALERE